MKGSAFKAWREGAGLSQQAVADRAGVNKRTVIRAEAESGKDVPAKLALLATPELLPDKIRPAPTKAEAADAKRMAALLKRNPLYAETPAEARAMRAALADAAPAPFKGMTSRVPLIPLRPPWQMVGTRRVHASIPEPLDVAPPASAGWRGVVSKSGAIYDYETGHQMGRARG